MASRLWTDGQWTFAEGPADGLKDRDAASSGGLEDRSEIGVTAGRCRRSRIMPPASRRRRSFSKTPPISRPSRSDINRPTVARTESPGRNASTARKPAGSDRTPVREPSRGHALHVRHDLGDLDPVIGVNHSLWDRPHIRATRLAAIGQHVAQPCRVRMQRPMGAGMDMGLGLRLALTARFVALARPRAECPASSAAASAARATPRSPRSAYPLSQQCADRRILSDNESEEAITVSPLVRSRRTSSQSRFHRSLPLLEE
jgi:hypothetical protein